MNDSNKFPNQGFAAYNRPAPARQPGIVEKILGPGIAGKLRNPLVATGALLLVGAAFAGIIIASYPGDESAENVPVIKAQTTAFKDIPEAAGGMDIPFQDSTIFTSMRDGELEETAPIENLLAQEEPVDRFEMAEAAVTQTEQAAQAAAETEPASGAENIIEDVTTTINEAAPPAKTEETASIETPPKPEEKPFEITKIEETVEKVVPKDLMADAPPAQPEKPQQIYAAGSSPDTLDFVRSVLDQKDTKNVLDTPATNVASATSSAASNTTSNAPTAEQLSGIEPAAGASVAATAIEPGEYFVQLASVTSPAGAESEWGKLQKSYGSLLQSINHRVKRADLDKGTFYRIQAGPMSKDSANRLCDSIKAQKPGGCLVTK